MPLCRAGYAPQAMAAVRPDARCTRLRLSTALAHWQRALCPDGMRGLRICPQLAGFSAARALYFIRANTAFVHSLHVTAAHCTPYAFHLCWDYPQLAGLFCDSRPPLHSSNTAFVNSLYVPAAHCALGAIRPCWDYPQLAGLIYGSRLLLHSNPHRICPQPARTRGTLRT